MRRRHTRVPPPKDAGHPSFRIRISQSGDCFLRVSHLARILQPPAKGSAKRIRALAVAPARDETRANGVGAREAAAVLGRLWATGRGEGVQLGTEESGRRTSSVETPTVCSKYFLLVNVVKTYRHYNRPRFTQ